MSKEISKQEKEDYLSLMYEMKRKENQIVNPTYPGNLKCRYQELPELQMDCLERRISVKGRRKKNVLNADGIIQRAAMSGKKTMPYRVSAFGFWC